MNCAIENGYLNKDVVGNTLVLKTPLGGSSLRILVSGLCRRCPDEPQCRPEYQEDKTQGRYTITRNIEEST